MFNSTKLPVLPFQITRGNTSSGITSHYVRRHQANLIWAGTDTVYTDGSPFSIILSFFATQSVRWLAPSARRKMAVVGKFFSFVTTYVVESLLGNHQMVCWLATWLSGGPSNYTMLIQLDTDSCSGIYGLDMFLFRYESETYKSGIGRTLGKESSSNRCLCAVSQFYGSTKLTKSCKSLKTHTREQKVCRSVAMQVANVTLPI